MLRPVKVLVGSVLALTLLKQPFWQVQHADKLSSRLALLCCSNRQRLELLRNLPTVIFTRCTGTAAVSAGMRLDLVRQAFNAPFFVGLDVHCTHLQPLSAIDRATLSTPCSCALRANRVLQPPALDLSTGHET